MISHVVPFVLLNRGFGFRDIDLKLSIWIICFSDSSWPLVLVVVSLNSLGEMIRSLFTSCSLLSWKINLLLSIAYECMIGLKIYGKRAMNYLLYHVLFCSRYLIGNCVVLRIVPSCSTKYPHFSLEKRCCGSMDGENLVHFFPRGCSTSNQLPTVGIWSPKCFPSPTNNHSTWWIIYYWYFPPRLW